MNEQIFLTTYNKLALLILTTILLLCGAANAAERVFIPVPKNVIYAGQRLSGELLRDRSVPVKYLNKVSVFANPADVVGKVARTTLMPGRPIPLNYVVEPNVVEVNRKTLMRFEHGALKIYAEVAPLNNARTGEPVRARNIKTGIIVYGTANADGSISCGEFTVIRRLICLCLSAILCLTHISFVNAAVRIKDIVEIQGARENQLLGYGLVVGLNATGDSLRNSPFTEASIKSMLDQLGIGRTTDDFRTKNVAAVMVTAKVACLCQQGHPN